MLSINIYVLRASIYYKTCRAHYCSGLDAIIEHRLERNTRHHPSNTRHQTDRVRFYSKHIIIRVELCTSMIRVSKSRNRNVRN